MISPTSINTVNAGPCSHLDHPVII